MRVGRRLLEQRGVAVLLPPDLGGSLGRSAGLPVTPSTTRRLAAERLVIGVERDIDSGEVGHVLADRQLAVTWRPGSGS